MLQSAPPEKRLDIYIMPVGGEVDCFKRLKFVQKYETFAQKLSTPAEQEEPIPYLISKQIQYF